MSTNTLNVKHLKTLNCMEWDFYDIQVSSNYFILIIIQYTTIAKRQSYQWWSQDTETSKVIKLICTRSKEKEHEALIICVYKY